MAYNDSSVWVAKNDLGTHVDKFVDKKQTAFKHLLVEKHAATGLGGYNNQHRKKVGCQSWPGGISEGHDGAVDK